MLSILIPTYDYDCRHLVSDLHEQAEQTGVDYEIIVADDASPSHIYKEKNREINRLSHCRYIELPKNVGRAQIRNLLADKAQYEWLLFMDCDAKVISSTFIADYLHHTDAEVICGGLCHTDTLPSPNVSLRHTYEKRADKRRAAHYRKRAPYEQFTPFNFMIRRNVFITIRFCDSITGYGHEDTLFGAELAKRKAKIVHIDNPLIHNGLDTNEEFMRKTRAAIRNLAAMKERMENHSQLIALYRRLEKWHLTGWISRQFFLQESKMYKQLTLKSKPNLTLFSLYKLGYYCQLMQEKKSRK